MVRSSAVRAAAAAGAAACQAACQVIDVAAACGVLAAASPLRQHLAAVLPLFAAGRPFQQPLWLHGPPTPTQCERRRNRSASVAAQHVRATPFAAAACCWPPMPLRLAIVVLCRHDPALHCWASWLERHRLLGQPSWAGCPLPWPCCRRWGTRRCCHHRLRAVMASAGLSAHQRLLLR